MAETKQIKILKPWQCMAGGSIQNFPVSIADTLIKEGRAEEVKEAQTHAPALKLKKPKRARTIEGK